MRVSVTDTGVGIPENEIDHVFEKFYRVNKNKKVAFVFALLILLPSLGLLVLLAGCEYMWSQNMASWSL